ncbi:MAG TPA: deoxyguanosinetriphosphate triphosphohydrolase, partial [Terriglobales bacterium]|nr:deoxyguanosinetriphosphate triphosphohydrolase [Terriglobales bacterium]
DICLGIEIFNHYYEQAAREFPNAIEKLKFNEALKRMLNCLADDLIHNTQENIRRAAVKSIEDVRKHLTRLAGFSPEVDSERRQVKQFLYGTLYFSPMLQPEKEDAEQVIGDLFAHWVAKPDSLPLAYREKARQEPVARVVCDYIAGMTDNFIYEQYGRMKEGRL